MAGKYGSAACNQATAIAAPADAVTLHHAVSSQGPKHPHIHRNTLPATPQYPNPYPTHPAPCPPPRRSLKVEGALLTPESHVQALAALTRLTSLQVAASEYVQSPVVRGLLAAAAELRGLQELSLPAYSGLDAAGLAQLARLTGLGSLTLEQVGPAAVWVCACVFVCVGGGGRAGREGAGPA